MNLPELVRRSALAAGSCIVVASLSRPAPAESLPCPPDVVIVAPAITYVAEEHSQPSWIFRRGTYTHDPYTGARVAQYLRKPPVEPLDDERMVTSRYRRSRTVLRGIDGSVDTYYEVQAWGNGRGGLDAEWERFHDAWKESFHSGGYYHERPWGYGNFGPGYGGFPGGYEPSYGPGDGYGHPGYGFPGYGPVWPGHGHGGRGHGGHGHHRRPKHDHRGDRDDDGPHDGDDVD